MLGVRFSRLAKADLSGIDEYTISTWGISQANRYLDELQACCQRLALSPFLGRACDEIHPGLRRFENGEHVILYLRIEDDILIARVLHRRMLPGRHHIDDAS